MWSGTLPWRCAKPAGWAERAERTLLFDWGGLLWPPRDREASNRVSPEGAAPGLGDEAVVSPKTQHGGFLPG